MENVNSNETLVNNLFTDDSAENTQAVETTNEQEVESESKVTENTQESEQDSKLAARFAALSRKEKAIRQREKEIEARMAEIEAKLAESQPKPEPEISWDKKFIRNPLEALEERGYSYDDLTQIALNEGKLTPELQMKVLQDEIESKYSSKIQELEEKLETFQKTEAQKQEERQISDFKNKLNSEIDASEEYDLIKAKGEYDLVFDVIAEHYNNTGEILDTHEAAKQVESYLYDQHKSVFEKSKKLKGLFQKPSEPKKEVPRQSQPTLSNEMSAISNSKADNTSLSREESLSRAANLIKWD